MAWIALAYVLVDWTVGVGGLLFCVYWEVSGGDPFGFTSVDPSYYPALFGSFLGIITVTKLILGRGGSYNV